MKLESLKPAQGSVKTNTRLGRGQGSGGGGTAKRGHKGAKSRSGYSQKRGFEGGQMPLQRRVPKFGFKNINRIAFKPINLDTIQELFEKTNEANITLEFLRNNGLIAKNDIVKVLGRGEFTAKVNVSVHAFSKSALEAIKNAGGTTSVIATTSSFDDLTAIEGIGPKIAAVLNSNKITTFAKLASLKAEEVSAMLAKASSRFASHNPATWGQQAELAAAGKWDELKQLQDQLIGGRPE